MLYSEVVEPIYVDSLEVQVGQYVVSSTSGEVLGL